MPIEQQLRCRWMPIGFLAEMTFDGLASKLKIAKNATR